MSLKLYYHPLASFCWKALIAMYETGTPFEPVIIDLADATSRAELLKLWPIGKFPVLLDETAGRTIPESSIIIEYLAEHHPGRTRLVPADTDLAREARLLDRLHDFYVQEPMQKIVGDRLRPADQKDPYGVAQAAAQLATSYRIIDRDMARRTWAVGDSFSMADCAAGPALFYASKVAPFGDDHRNVAAYLSRLTERPSFARVLEEAQPYFKMFPQ